MTRDLEPPSGAVVLHFVVRKTGFERAAMIEGARPLASLTLMGVIARPRDLLSEGRQRDGANLHKRRTADLTRTDTGGRWAHPAGAGLRLPSRTRQRVLGPDGSRFGHAELR